MYLDCLRCRKAGAVKQKGKDYEACGMVDARAGGLRWL